jgi:glutaredoxin
LGDLIEGDKIILPSTSILPGYDIKCNSETQCCVSENIEKENPESIAYFLSGIFSLYGKIFIDMAQNIIIRIFSSVNLTYQVQNLLRCFGISSTVTKIYDKQKYQGMLSISKLSSIINYSRFIGFCLSKEKQKKLDTVLNSIESKKEKIVTQYTKVISVTYIGKEKVYDLNIPEKHNFIVEGLVVHNCNLSSIGLPMFLQPKAKIFEEAKIIVYTIKKCDWCRLAKGILKENKIKFIEKFIHTEEEKNEIKKKYNIQTFPQVIKVKNEKEEKIGGFTELIKLLRPDFNFQKLYEVTKIITRNLNRVIDLNYYPTDCTRNSNFKNRPMGIGVQGLADVFLTMKIPFESEEAQELNRNIFETIYYSSLETSMELALEEGVYSSYEGSPISEGKFQFDLWNKYRNTKDNYQFKLSGKWDFEALRNKIKENGVRNSLLTAPMPTASTSQILGNNEAFEPYTSNIYTRRTLAGEFPIINKHLVKDLINCNLWTGNIKEKILFYKGSVQNIKEIPLFLKKIYKTVWEIKQKTIIDMAADRGHFVCQSQSLNIHLAEPSNKIINSVLFYGWKRGLKTGIYYLRTLPRTQAQQISIDPVSVKRILEDDNQEEECIMCSS